KYSLSIALLFLGFCVHAQIDFEKGYLITRDGNKKECWIKNSEWKNTPQKFKYKLGEEGEVQTGKPEDIQEFGIEDVFVYRRFEVEIDRSSNDSNNLDWDRDPKFQSETLFLKTLVKGSISLHYYEFRNLRRFFYEDSSGKVAQLVYKKYKVSDAKETVNRYFRKQLYDLLACNQNLQSRIMTVEYNQRELIQLFALYHDCANAPYKNLIQKKHNKNLQLSLRAGVVFSPRIDISRVFFTRQIFGPAEQERTIRWGLEAEMIVPFQKGKWRVFTEPTYQSFQFEQEIEDVRINVDYKSIELPIGVRHCFFLNEEALVFVNAMVSLDLEMDSQLSVNERTFDISSAHTYAFGLGFRWHRFGIESRYYLKRNLFNVGGIWKAEYNNNFSIALGFRFL
ncbi:MAG: hypothetical protein AAFV25_18785, partial [Bacteroidota bacterium]